MAGRSILLIVLALGCGVSALADQPAVEVRAPHFTVYSDAGAKTARRIAVRFEQVRAAFGVLWPWARIDPGASLVILALDDEGTQELLPRSGSGGRAEIAGFFSAGAGRYYIAVRADLVEGRNDQALHVVFHEYAHLVLDLNFERLPLWMNEGLAELFGGGVVRSGYVELGRPIASHIGRLRVNTLSPLDDLFAVDRSSPEYSEERRVTLFYAQSWALVHYLMVDQRESRPESVAQLFGYLAANMDSLAALRAAGFDPAELERDLASYVLRPSLSSIRALTEEAPSDRELPSRPLGAAEWDATRALFLAHLGQSEAALALLEPSLEAAPDLALAHEARALVRFRQRDLEQAVESAEESVRLAPDSLSARYTAALAHLHRGEATQGKAPAVVHLRRAIELGPDYAPAHGWLARALLRQGSALEEAVEHARQAATLEPSSAGHRIVLAQALDGMGSFQEARSEAERALALSRSPSDRAEARALLQEVAARVPVQTQEEACAAGDGRACVELGARYHSGVGVEPSAKRALELFRHACAVGLAVGCTHQALALVASGSPEADLEAAALLDRACGQGDARACGALGALVEVGRGGPSGTGRALDLHRRACEGGYEPSCERVTTLEGETATRVVEGWGELVDPAGTSRVAAKDGRLTFEVPGGPHDLSVEIGEMAAPRLLQPVEGDFVAEVTVLSKLRPDKESAVRGRWPYHGAGLLLWIDGGNYVRLEAATITDLDGIRTVYTLFELRSGGRLRNIAGRRAGVGVGPPIRLKLERTDSGLRAYYRRRGDSDWRRAGEIEGTFPRRMMLGVAAVNTSRRSLRVDLEDLRVDPLDSLN